MIFRRIILNALLIGFLTGSLLSIIQLTALNPIIFSAEAFETPSVGASSDVHDVGHHDHTHHEHDAAPADNRTFYTVISNVFAGIGFSALILSLMSYMHTQSTRQLNLTKGVAWGIAGFLCFFVAPGIGLPPDIPGVNTAQIEHRQLWWIFTVCSVGIGLLCIAFAPEKYKLLGLICLVVPYLVTTPSQNGPTFSSTDASTIESLTMLHRDFIFISGATNFVFWITLGLISSWCLIRINLKDKHTSAHA